MGGTSHSVSSKWSCNIVVYCLLLLNSSGQRRNVGPSDMHLFCCNLCDDDADTLAERAWTAPPRMFRHSRMVFVYQLCACAREDQDRKDDGMADPKTRMSATFFKNMPSTPER